MIRMEYSEKNDHLFDAKILLVDDNLSNVLLLQKILQLHGYKNLKYITDSRETIDTYITYQPDLLLLDLRMPYMDGLEVLKKLNEIKGDDYLPVIIVTAQDDKETRLKGYELGAKDFISKPIDHIEVLIRIKNMLEMRLMHNDLKSYNKQLEEKVEARAKELNNMHLELINRLLLIVEFRDDNTGKHIMRIGAYVSELCRVMGLSNDYCSKLFHASMMHDVGKIAIPDEVLLKPGKLTPDEFDRMKQHTIKGYEMLKGSNSEVINLAEQIALTHHERWDGTGYPNGLRGEDIPLCGRITALIDVFDALLTKRPYKEPWALDDVLKYISAAGGGQFDPNIVAVFMAHLQNFIAIKNSFDT